MKVFFTLLLGLLLILFGCDNGIKTDGIKTDGIKTDGIKTDGTKTDSLKVRLQYEQHQLTCDSSVNRDQMQWQLAQLHFFIADIEVLHADGSWQPWPLNVTPMQQAHLALLGQNCQTKEQGNWQLNFAQAVDMADVRQIRFNIGVPFVQNHLNPLTQESPLNVSSMFWVWQTGHKFMRMEWVSETDNWLFHLGSAGCKSPSVMRSPQSGCRYPNYYPFVVSVEANTDTLVMNVSALLQDIDLSDHNNCQSEPENTNCQQLFSNMSNDKNNEIFRASYE